jgi:pectate lyase
MKRALFLAGLFAALLLYPAFPVFAADGFGQSTTGGAGGTTVTATTAALLKSYVESTSTYIVQVSGTIDLNSVGGGVKIKSNKTIKGIGTNPKIIGRLGFTDGNSNIIIERLTITNLNYKEADGISVKNTVTNLFITKCTIYDCNDGCIDITNASDYVTVSWCKFYYTAARGHNFVNLFSSSDDAIGDRGKLRITFHHNWWSALCDQRMPRGRFGQVHVYNNYYRCTGNLYCIGVGLESQIRVESNYFDSVTNAWYNPATTPGKIGWNSDNQFVNGTTIPTWAPNDYNTVFTPPYSYTLDDANDIPAMVQSGAGADGNDFFPHWLFGPYGDFDRSGIVDANDLKQFAENYWLVNDEEQIADADYNGDGIVNFYEFALLAENWLKEEE